MKRNWVLRRGRSYWPALGFDKFFSGFSFSDTILDKSCGFSFNLCVFLLFSQTLLGAVSRPTPCERGPAIALGEDV